MEAVSKLVSILLLAIFGLPLVSPLLAATAVSETNLPACCRRAGRHHCMISSAERSQFVSKQTELRSPQEKCPFCPAAIMASHHPQVGLATAETIFAGLVSHPAAPIQTESKWRIARDRSRGKRGPPSLSLL